MNLLKTKNMNKLRKRLEAGAKGAMDAALANERVQAGVGILSPVIHPSPVCIRLT
jgi:hypothetical protein